MDRKMLFQLRITLREVEPPVWRRLLVPIDIKLDKLHTAFQRAMGWTNSHLHEFVLGEARIGMVDVDNHMPTIDERKITLDEIARPDSRFGYDYDFGDGWKHEVIVEDVLPAVPGESYPQCIAGERACPPEDCGGPHGYQELIKILANPRHKQHAELKRWLGRPLDPEAFNLAKTNPPRHRARATSTASRRSHDA